MGLTSIQNVTDSFAELRAAFAEDKECEHSVHKTRPTYHSGRAEWYGEYRCPNCGDAPGMSAYCAPWKAYVDTDPMVQCMACGIAGRAQSEFYQGRWHKI